MVAMELYYKKQQLEIGAFLKMGRKRWAWLREEKVQWKP